MTGFTEKALLLGQQRSMVGILTRGPVRNENPAIVILNTGIMHRVGHHRMYVAMSRALAGAGYTVLRFDFSGVGDSGQRADGLTPLESCLADIREALDSLEREGQASRFILVGLCSGADHGVLYGYQDPRVVGLVLMDPSIPRTARYYVHYIAQRLTHLRNWSSVVMGRSGLLKMLIEQLFRRPQTDPRPGAMTLDELPFSPHLAQCYKRSVERGTQMLAVFTQVSPRHTYETQLIDAFPDVPFDGRLKLASFPHSDHLFVSEKDRSGLTRLILDWLDAIRHPLQSAESPAK